MNVRHILFPVDFSPRNALVAPYVRALAGKFGARLTQFSVAPPVWTEPPHAGGTVSVTAHASALELRIRERLDNAFTTDLSGLTVERVVQSGEPAAEIVRFAEGHGVDLIMMATHGHGIFRSRLMGSVASKVLHDSPCPVWTAAHAAAQSTHALPRTILCAVDQAAGCAGLMRWAATFSHACGAELKLLHVIPSAGDWMTLPSESAMQDVRRKEARAKLDAVRDATSIKAPLRIAPGEVAQTVAAEARIEDADLVVIARGETSKARYGTHARGIVHHSPCPVLTVPL